MRLYRWGKGDVGGFIGCIEKNDNIYITLGGTHPPVGVFTRFLQQLAGDYSPGELKFHHSWWTTSFGGRNHIIRIVQFKWGRLRYYRGFLHESMFGVINTDELVWPRPVAYVFSRVLREDDECSIVEIPLRGFDDDASNNRASPTVEIVG